MGIVGSQTEVTVQAMPSRITLSYLNRRRTSVSYPPVPSLPSSSLQLLAKTSFPHEELNKFRCCFTYDSFFTYEIFETRK